MTQFQRTLQSLILIFVWFGFHWKVYQIFMSRCFDSTWQNFIKLDCVFLYQRNFTKWGEADDDSKKSEVGDKEEEAMDTMSFGWGAQFIKLWANWSCPSPYFQLTLCTILFDFLMVVDFFFFYLGESFRKYCWIFFYEGWIVKYCHVKF